MSDDELTIDRLAFNETIREVIQIVKQATRADVASEIRGMISESTPGGYVLLLRQLADKVENAKK